MTDDPIEPRMTGVRIKSWVWLARTIGIRRAVRYWREGQRRGWMTGDETDYLLRSAVNAQRLMEGIEQANRGEVEEHELHRPDTSPITPR